MINNSTLEVSKKVRIEAVDDALVVSGCVNGDRNSQKLLFEKYCREMHRMASLIVNSDELANDVLQESFIKVFKNLKSLREPGKLKWWIKTTVLRTALETKKEEAVFTYSKNGYGEVIEWPNDLSGEYLKKAISFLPFGYRTVFVMIEIEGYSHKETSDMLNIAEGTSKSQLYYAKKKLIKIIEQLLTT